MDYDMKGEGNSVLLPEGWHSVIVTDVQLSMSKSGNEMWVITTEEPKSGSTDTTYAVAVKGKRWLLRSFLESCRFESKDGVFYNVEPTECIGLTVEALNNPEPNEFVNRSGESIKETRNKFNRFRVAKEKATI